MYVIHIINIYILTYIYIYACKAESFFWWWCVRGFKADLCTMNGTQPPTHIVNRVFSTPGKSTNAESELCHVFVVYACVRFFVFFCLVFKELKATDQGLLGRVMGLPFPQQALSNHQTEAAFHVCKGLVPVKRGSLSEDLGPGIKERCELQGCRRGREARDTRGYYM